VGLLSIAVSAVLASAPARPESDLPITLAQAKERPANLSKYSLRYWPKGSLRIGQVVSTDTPYGRLTCRNIRLDLPRECWLSPR
jgi:hypothetical protein